MEAGPSAQAFNRLSILSKQMLPVADAQQLSMQTCSAGDSAAYERRTTPLDEVVIVSALRTPLTKAKRGGLRDTDAIELLSTVFKAVLDQTHLDPAAIGDIVVGSVLGPSSQRANEARIASFFAGIPEEVPVRTVNRQCSSGLQAIADVAAAIRAGFYTVGLAAGVETMSSTPMAWEGGINSRISEFPKAQGCMLPMGVTSENVAAKFGVSRRTQDEFAVRSHKKAAAAAAAGKFKEEIVPVKTKVIDPKTQAETPVVISADDGIRADVSVEALAGLRAVFLKDGSTTAGNASQVTDGAAAVLLMTRREAIKRGLPVLGIFRSFAAVGVDPAIMGVGPAAAIPAALAQAGLTTDDIDVYEINEAFASQASYSIAKLGIDESKVNPNGGAIALGHPLGATGARCTATLLHEMRRRGRAARFGVVSMCIGSGMGAAAVFEAGGRCLAPCPQDFVFFLAQLQNLTYLAVYFTVLGLRRLDKRPLWAVGACEAVAQLLFMIGASHLPGALLPVISQSYLIWNLLLASLLLGTRFSRHQVMGVMLILLGVVLAAVPPPTLLSLLPLGLQQSLSAGPAAAEAAAGAAGAGSVAAARAAEVAGGQLGHALVCLLCFAFFALAAIIKDATFRREKERLGQPLDIFVVNSFGSLFQAVFVLLLLPVTTAMYGLSLADLPTYLADGWHCLCGHPPAAALAQQLAAATGQGAGGVAAAAVTQAGVAAAGGGGTGAPLLPALYVAVNLGFNVASLRLLR
ncbi:hypothetical protein QJQ45_030117 [Haematococcus lacustris]|nr:hypothetical protein QJQ45_030117 [Haematococcus lacustris]